MKLNLTQKKNQKILKKLVHTLRIIEFKNLLNNKFIRGAIYKVKQSLFEKIEKSIKKNRKIKIKLSEEKDKIESTICKIEGNWLEYLEIDGNL